MKLCSYDEDTDMYYPVIMPWDYINSFKRKIISKIFYFLDKDTKHAMICKIIHRCKKPNNAIGLLESWFCVRCGEKRELNLMIDASIISGGSVPQDWKNYCKMIDLPYLNYSYPNPENKEEKTHEN